MSNRQIFALLVTRSNGQRSDPGMRFGSEAAARRAGLRFIRDHADPHGFGVGVERITIVEMAQRRVAA